MKFIRHAVQDREEDAGKIRVAREKRVTDLVVYGAVDEETENAIIDEVDKLGPPPEFHVREIVSGNGGADEYHHHPERDRKEISHHVSILSQIALFFSSVLIPVASLGSNIPLPPRNCNLTTPELVMRITDLRGGDLIRRAQGAATWTSAWRPRP